MPTPKWDCNIYCGTSANLHKGVKNNYEVFYSQTYNPPDRRGKHYYSITACDLGLDYWKRNGWDVRSPEPSAAAIPIIIQGKDGNWCSECSAYVRQSENNQINGTFICWQCRNYPHYGSVIE